MLGIASPAFSRHHAVVVPAATIERVLAALLAHGRVPRSHLGIAVQPVRATLEGAAVEGLLVSSVAEDGPAATGGLLVGDVIVEAGGRPARELEALRATIAEAPPGAALALTVSRAGQRVSTGRRRGRAAPGGLPLSAALPMAGRPRIAIVGAAPWLAQGLASALADEARWELIVQPGSEVGRRLCAACARRGRCRRAAGRAATAGTGVVDRRRTGVCRGRRRRRPTRPSASCRRTPGPTNCAPR